MDFMEYRLSTFKNEVANQFGHNVFYNNVLIRVFYLLEKRINTCILFLGQHIVESWESMLTSRV